MNQTLIGVVLGAVLATGPARAQVLFELNLNTVPTPEAVVELEELFDVPPGLLIGDFEAAGFSSRVLPLRPAKEADEVFATLSRLGIVSTAPEVIVEDPEIVAAEAVEQTQSFEMSTIRGVDVFGPILDSTDILVTPNSIDSFLPQAEVDLANILGPINTNPKDSSQPVVSALQVTQGLPDGASVLQASTGQCTAGPPDWPFDAGLVAEVIRYGRAVLREAGLGNPLRARILVVDSGLPAAVIAQPDFARMLDVNWAEAMGGGRYAASPEDPDRNRSCTDPDADGGAVRYGFVTRSETAAAPDFYCGAADPLVSIAPPIPDPPIPDYDPAHGALVAGLAMGGPALSTELPDLNVHLGVSMARIVRSLTTDGRVLTVSSAVSDAVEGISRANQPFSGIFGVTGHPQARRFDVLNLSLSISPTTKSPDWNGELAEYVRSGGLVVVAAGNGGAKIRDEVAGEALDQSLIEALSSPTGFDFAITVGGTAPLSTGGTGHHPQSNHSPSLVDIAAPATGALSWGLDGQPACAVGTSISTPQVSFVAAMLVSFGVWNNAEVKRRILATADIEPALFDQVRRGRVLNVASALDVFADLIWLTDPADPARIAQDPLRVRILDLGDQPTGMMLKFCDGPRDFIDTRSLVLWERRPDGLVEFWREGRTMTPLGTTCQPGTDRLVVQFLDDGRIETLELADIARIVPSRFRLGPEALRVALAD